MSKKSKAKTDLEESVETSPVTDDASPEKILMDTEVFVSHKRVKRVAMNRADYNIYRGWKLPKDEDGTDDGYLVEYLDGGEPNHPDHNGYISWSPKEQFDNGYSAVDCATPPEHLTAFAKKEWLRKNQEG